MTLKASRPQFKLVKLKFSFKIFDRHLGNHGVRVLRFYS